MNKAKMKLMIDFLFLPREDLKSSSTIFDKITFTSLLELNCLKETEVLIINKEIGMSHEVFIM